MKFIVTDELGRLATWLRILGFDTVVESDRAGLVIESLRGERVILTRDSKMSRFTGTRMLRVKSDFVETQLEQVLQELDIAVDRAVLFSRCVLCNTVLEKTPKSDVKERVPGYVYETQEVFTKCPACHRIYWRGTHWALANQFLDRVGL